MTSPGNPTSRTSRGSLEITALFAVLGMLAAWPYRGQLHGGLNDEGLVLQAAYRIVSGEVPYRDFDMLYTPGSMMSVALWFKIFGVSMGSARWLMVLLGGVFGAMIYRLSHRLLKAPYRYLPPLLFALSGYSEWPIINYHWFSILGLLSSLVLLLEWYRQPEKPWIVAVGLAVGFAGASLQSEGVTGVVAVSAVLLSAAKGRGWASTARDLLKFLAGIATIWVPLLLYLAWNSALGSFFTNTVSRVLGGLYRNHGDPYSLQKFLAKPWIGFFSQWPDSWNGARALWALESLTTLLTWTLKYGLLFPIMAGGLFLAYRKGGGWIAASLYLVIWFIVARERMDLLYSNYLMPLWYVVLAGCLQALEEKKRVVGRALLYSLLTLYVAVTAVALRYCSSFVYPVEAPRGTLWAREPEEASLYQALYSTAFQLTPPGTPSFAWPNAAGFTFLAALDNVTRLEFLVPGWQDADQVRAASRALRQSGVTYIYHLPLSDDLLDDYPYLDPAEFKRGLQDYQGEILQGAPVVGRVGPFEVYQLDSSESKER